jgi:antitoxin ParD1/3/4
MTVKIGSHFEKLIAELVAAGRFQNRSDVVRASLRLLEEREYRHDQSLEAELLKRLDSPSTPWKKSDLDQVRKAARRTKRTALKRAA